MVYMYNIDHDYQRIKNYPMIDNLEDKKIYDKEFLLSQGFSIGQINTLKKHHVFIQQSKHVHRDIKHVFDRRDKIVNLNQEQLEASAQIKASFKKHKTFLLKGITGSGKTEVYLDLLEEVLNQKQKALVLVPEITLIAPMAKRLKSRFDRVAIYHSALSKGERYDQYQMVLNDEVDIIIATRSGVFLPIHHLGLIIIDEEHDGSYMQKEGVIYDAKEIALLRAKYHQIPLVLGSATPSIASMYLAKEKTYELLTLTKRPFELKEPDILFVDMKQELKNNNTSIFCFLIEKVMLHLYYVDHVVM